MSSKPNFALESSKFLILPLFSKRSPIWSKKNWFEKCNNSILYYCQYYVYQINWETTADKTLGGEDKYLLHLFNISWLNFGNFFTIFCFILKLEWNTKFFLRWLLIRNKGITFQAWKLVSYSLLTQEHWRLIIIWENIHVF